MNFPETVESWREALNASFNHAFSQIIDKAPHVVGMLLVLVAGYLIARILDRVVSTVSDSLGLQTAAERSGLLESMRQGGHQSQCFLDRRPDHLLAYDVRVLDRRVQYPGPADIDDSHGEPGGLHTQAARGHGRGGHWLADCYVRSRGGRHQRPTAWASAMPSIWPMAPTTCSALMTFIAAFDQLGFQFDLLKDMILIAFGAVAAGSCSGSLGLGGKEVMGGILAGYYTRQRLHAGDHVHVCGMEGTVREVGAGGHRDRDRRGWPHESA